jgi:CHASE2 domain-containing sensor protein
MSVLDYFRALPHLRHRPTLDSELRKRGLRITRWMTLLSMVITVYALSRTQRHAPMSELVATWAYAAFTVGLAGVCWYFLITGWWRELK